VTNNRIWTYVANKVTAFDPKFTKIFETSVSTNKYLYATFLPAPSGNKWALYARLKSNSYTAIALYDKTKFIKLFDYHATYSVSGFQFNRDGSRMYVAIKKPFVGSDSRLYSYNTSDGSTRFQYTAPKLSADENLRGDSDIRMIQGFSFVDISNNNDLAVNAYDTMMTLVFDDNGKIKLKINRDKFGQNSGAADGLIYSHLSVYDKRGTLVDTLPEYKPTRTPNLQGYFYGAAHDVFVLHDSNIYRYVPQHADILNHWAYDSMMMLEKNSVMEAARPNEIVTSSQFINIASRLDLSRPIDTSFLNAADKTITKRMIASTLGEYAYILGDNNYDKALTRAEVAVITVRYINALK
jgi:hypothetical protein